MENTLIIPHDFEDILKRDARLYALVIGICSRFAPLINEPPYFFPAYTNHQLLHSQKVLDIAKLLIAPSSFNTLTPQDIAVLILSALAHDLGMHITFAGFRALIHDEYNENRLNEVFKDKNWSRLWYEYKKEIRLWDQKKKTSVFSKKFDIVEIPDDPLELTELQRMIIGEFLRWHHHRLAQDIITSGFPMRAGEYKEFFPDENEYQNLQTMTALLVRSHGENAWRMIDIVENIYGRNLSLSRLFNCHFSYVMTLLRLSDYLDMSEERASLDIYRKHDYFSSVSALEWEFNQCIDSLDFKESGSERLYIWVSEPRNSTLFLKIQRHLKSMQDELDTCWAVLGYTRTQEELSIRHISSNLDTEGGLKDSVPYLPEPIYFDSNKDLLKLLVKPLYGNDILLAVRELLQNAVDACREKEVIAGTDYTPLVEIRISQDSISVTDNGMGMTPYVIKNYYLKVGATYRNDLNWKKHFLQDGRSIIIRGGRFGIGVLAGFLIGDEIAVETQPLGENTGYRFIADLNAEQIDVFKTEKKESNCSGTRITIKNNGSIARILHKEALKDIYTLSSPQIRLVYGNKDGNEKGIILNSMCHVKNMYHFFVNDVDVYWKPSETSDKMVSYNGFWLKGESFSHNIDDLKQIEVHLVDKDNKLELELNRNSISNIDFIKKNFLLQIILQLSNIYMKQRCSMKQLCGTLFDCPLLTWSISGNDLVKRAYVLTEKGYAVMGFLCHLDSISRRLIVLDQNPGDDLIFEILHSNSHPLLIVGQPCDIFLDKRLNYRKKLVWERLISKTSASLYQSPSYSDLKYISQLFSKYYNYWGNYSSRDQLEGKIVISRGQDRDKFVPFLSKDLYKKLIEAGCQIAEYTIENARPLMDKSIFTNELFANYVSSTLKENIILPYI